MKIIVSALLFLIVGCTNNKSSYETKKPLNDFVPVVQYHIKAECWDEGGYSLAFTNDNWETKDYIMDAFDISDDIEGNHVVLIKKVFLYTKNNLQSAIQLAKQFKTYKSCIEYNEHVKRDYQRLKEFRDKHPIPKKEQEKPKEVCCKEVVIY